MSKATWHRRWTSGARGRMAHAAFAVAILLAGAVHGTGEAQAQTFTVLHTFSTPNQPPFDGASPFAGLIQDPSGNFYGTTSDGGTFGCCSGTVFKIDASGAYTLLHSFNGVPGDGNIPGRGHLVRDAAGNLYGTTLYGGSGTCGAGSNVNHCGTVFKVDTAGNETVLYRFVGGTDGYWPEGGVSLDQNGNLYGTTLWGGDPACSCGTVFVLKPTGNGTWTHTVLHSFTGPDGNFPVAAPIQGRSGNFYGTTSGGNGGGPGTVFELTESGILTVLHAFGGFAGGGQQPDGLQPFSGLIEDASGNFYGTTFYGGNDGCVGECGTVFKVDAAGNETILYAFTGGTDGGNPGGSLALDTNGNLYGVTLDGGGEGACTVGGKVLSCGVVFTLDAAGNETVLYRFTGGSDGSVPWGSLILDGEGNLYGTASEGGTFGVGTVFKLTLLPTPTVTVTPSASSITTAQALTVTVAVNGGHGNPTPTGTVTLSSGGYTSTTTTISGGSATINIPAGSLAVGTDRLTARYSGDSNYDPTAGNGSVTVMLLVPTVTVTPSASSITTAQALTVTVAVSGGSGNPMPTGTTTLSSGSYTSGATTLSGGSATINIPAGLLSVGTDTITGSYSGDSNYSAATGSNSVTVTVAPTPSFSVGGTSVSVSRGATGGNTSTITVTPSGGFTGNVTLTATITSSPAGAQDPPTFRFGSTSPVSITNANAGTATLTISTTAATSGALINPVRPQFRWYAAASVGLTFAAVFGMGIPARRRSWTMRFGLLMLLVVLSGGLFACGGGGSGGGGGGGGGGNQGTTPGSYTVTITGTSGNTTATGTITLTVQ